MPREEWRARFAQPAARIEQARWLAAHGTHAAIDISDGLVADLRHVAAASGVRLVLALDALPTVSGCVAGRGGQQRQRSTSSR